MDNENLSHSETSCLTVAPLYGLTLGNESLEVSGITLSYLPTETWLKLEKEGITMDRSIRLYYESNQPLYASIKTDTLDNTVSHLDRFRSDQDRIENLVIALKLSIDDSFVDPKLVGYYSNESFHYLRDIGPYRQYFYHNTLKNNYCITDTDLDKINKTYALIEKIDSFVNFNSIFIKQSILGLFKRPVEVHGDLLFKFMSCFEILETIFGRTYKSKNELSFAERVARSLPDTYERQNTSSWIDNDIIPIRDNLMHSHLSITDELRQSSQKLTDITTLIMKGFIQHLNNYEINDIASAKSIYRRYNEEISGA